MRKKLSLVIFAVLFLLPIQVFASTKTDSNLDGNDWIQWSKIKGGNAMKTGWVMGYSSGSFETAIEWMQSDIAAWTVASDSNQELKPEYKEAISKNAKHYWELMGRSSGDYGQIVEVIDKFYKDPLNKRVTLPGAFWIAELSLQGAPQEFIDQMTRLLRMPEEERITEFESLIRENPTYKKSFKKWGLKIPTHLFGGTVENVPQLLQE